MAEVEVACFPRIVKSNPFEFGTAKLDAAE